RNELPNDSALKPWRSAISRMKACASGDNSARDAAAWHAGAIANSSTIMMRQLNETEKGMDWSGTFGTGTAPNTLLRIKSPRLPSQHETALPELAPEFQINIRNAQIWMKNPPAHDHDRLLSTVTVP